MPALEEMFHDELITFVADRDAGIVARDAQTTVMAGQLSELMEANEVLAEAGQAGASAVAQQQELVESALQRR